jgi:hypothetical protein
MAALSKWTHYHCDLAGFAVVAADAGKLTLKFTQKCKGRIAKTKPKNNKVEEPTFYYFNLTRKLQ